MKSFFSRLADLININQYYDILSYVTPECCMNIDANTSSDTVFTTKTEDMSLVSKVSKDGCVEICATFDNNINDSIQDIVNVILSTASQYFMSNVNNIVVHIKFGDDELNFEADMDNKVFNTTMDGVHGYMMTTDSSDMLIRNYRFEAYDDSDIVDKTHVYTTDELDKFANFMCNVVCGDCKNDTCCGCEVVGEDICDCDNDVCICTDDYNNVTTTCDDIVNTDFVIPETVSEHDFAGYIKNVVNRKTYVDIDLMLANLKNVFVQGKYEIENNVVIVPLEELIPSHTYFDDVNVAKTIVEYESESLTTFLSVASDRFGFKNATFEIDSIFNCIDLKFNLPE